MTTTPEQIDLWRSVSSEDQRLEFKEAKTQFDNRKLLRYCVAIANEGGGVLLLGIADKPPRPVVGTAAFNNTVEMASRILEAVGFRVDIEEVMHSGKRVLVFHIPSRPRGTAYHLDGAYLMRSGEDLVPMTEDQLRRIFSEGGGGLAGRTRHGQSVSPGCRGSFGHPGILRLAEPALPGETDRSHGPPCAGTAGG